MAQFRKGAFLKKTFFFKKVLSEKGSFCINDKNETVGASFSFCNSTVVDVQNITDLQLLDFRSDSSTDCPLRNNSDLTNALQLSTV